MADAPTPVTDDDVVRFFMKLKEFNATLSAPDRSLLHEMTAAALRAPAPEVEGFAMTNLLRMQTFVLSSRLHGSDPGDDDDKLTSGQIASFLQG